MASSSRNQVFNPGTFEEERLTCSKCNWVGKGGEAIKIDLYNVTTTNEIRCPDCDSLLGILPTGINNLGDSGNQIGAQIG